MFLVNSRLGLFSATTLGSRSKSLHHCGYPLSRSYGYILPSSLTRVLPRTLDSLPAYLCRFTVRAAAFSLEAFLGSVGSIPSGTSSLHITPQPQYTDLPVHQPARLYAIYHSRADLPSCVTPSFKRLLPVLEYQPVVHLLRSMPRIRSRLTLRRRSLLRNPYAFGG